MATVHGHLSGARIVNEVGGAYETLEVLAVRHFRLLTTSSSIIVL
jgi:hypothetical protein